jgi:hypothetical protein
LTPAESTNESAAAADSDGKLFVDAPGEGVAVGTDVRDGVGDAADVGREDATGLGREDATAVGGDEATPVGGDEAMPVGSGEATPVGVGDGCGFSDGALPGSGVLVG